MNLLNFQQLAPRRHSNQRPKPTGSFRLEAAVTPLWAPHPISQAEPSRPTQESNFGRLYLCCYSFCHYHEFMTIWGLDRRSTAKSKALPSGSVCINACVVANPPVNLLLYPTLTHKQDPDIGSKSQPNSAFLLQLYRGTIFVYCRIYIDLHVPSIILTTIWHQTPQQKEPSQPTH